MKKIIPVVVILLLLAGAAYAYTRRPTSQAPTAPTNQTTKEAMSEGKEFADAVQSGKPTICTMSRDSETMEYRIKGKMMRGDITANNTKSHLISDNKYFYMWADGQKQGTKMSLTLPSPSPVSSMAPQERNSTPKFDSEQDYDKLKNQGYTINCVSGNVSDTDFVPPTDVTFTDLSSMRVQPVAPTQGSKPQIDYQKLQQQYGGTLPPRQ